MSVPIALEINLFPPGDKPIESVLSFVGEQQLSNCLGAEMFLSVYVFYRVGEMAIFSWSVFAFSFFFFFLGDVRVLMGMAKSKTFSTCDVLRCFVGTPHDSGLWWSCSSTCD